MLVHDWRHAALYIHWLQVILVMGESADPSGSEGRSSTAPNADSSGNPATVDSFAHTSSTSQLAHDEGQKPVMLPRPHRTSGGVSTTPEPPAAGQNGFQASDSMRSSNSCHTGASIPAAATSCATGSASVEHLRPFVSPSKAGSPVCGGDASQSTMLKRGFFGKSPAAAASKQTPSQSNASAMGRHEGNTNGISASASGTADTVPAAAQKAPEPLASKVSESTAAPAPETWSAAPPAPTDTNIYEAAQVASPDDELRWLPIRRRSVVTNAPRNSFFWMSIHS